MAWKEKPGKCIACGKPIILKSSRHRYCSECAKEMNLLRKIQSKDERNRRLRQKRLGLDPDWWKGRDTECKVKRSCIYGTNTICDYLAVEGRSRLLAGYPIRDGKCGLYQIGPKKRPRNMPLPEAPVMKSGKMAET